MVFGHSEQELSRALPGKQGVYLSAFTAQGVCGKAPPAIISQGREEKFREEIQVSLLTSNFWALDPKLGNSLKPLLNSLCSGLSRFLWVSEVC